MENLTLFRLGDLICLGSDEEKRLAKAEVIRRMPYLPQACTEARKVLKHDQPHPVTLPEYPGLQFFSNGQEILAFHHAWAHNSIWKIPAYPIRSL